MARPVSVFVGFGRSKAVGSGRYGVSDKPGGIAWMLRGWSDRAVPMDD